MSKDEKTNGPGGRNGGGRVTWPAGIKPPTPGDTDAHLERLEKFHLRSLEFLADARRLVREGGFDPRTCAVLMDAADHYDGGPPNHDGGLPPMALAAASTLRLLAVTQAKDRAE